MTAAEFAALLDARPGGARKWLARCPAHKDRSPSLSVGEGRDGRVLANCMAGCSVTAILKALGLRLRDLFASATPLTPEQRAAAERARRIANVRDESQKRIERATFDTERLSAELVKRIAEALSILADGDPQEKAMTSLYHRALDLFRQCEAASVSVLAGRREGGHAWQPA